MCVRVYSVYMCIHCSGVILYSVYIVYIESSVYSVYSVNHNTVKNCVDGKDQSAKVEVVGQNGSRIGGFW